MPRMRFDYAMTEGVRMRVSLEEKQALRRAAMAHGLSMAEFVRRASTEAARQVAA